jgi:hypothetical protein
VTAEFGMLDMCLMGFFVQLDRNAEKLFDWAGSNTFGGSVDLSLVHSTAKEANELLAAAVIPILNKLSIISAVREVEHEQAQLQREQQKRDQEETDARSWVDNLLRWNAKCTLDNNASKAEIDSTVAFHKVMFGIVIGLIVFALIAFLFAFVSGQQQPPLNRTAFTGSGRAMGEADASTGDQVRTGSTPIVESAHSAITADGNATYHYPAHVPAITADGNTTYHYPAHVPTPVSSSRPTPYVPDPSNYEDATEGVSVRRAQPVVRENLAPEVRRAEPVPQPSAVNHLYVISYFYPGKGEGAKAPYVGTETGPDEKTALTKFRQRYPNIQILQVLIKK